MDCTTQRYHDDEDEFYESDYTVYNTTIAVFTIYWFALAGTRDKQPNSRVVDVLVHRNELDDCMRKINVALYSLLALSKAQMTNMMDPILGFGLGLLINGKANTYTITFVVGVFLDTSGTV